MSEYSNSLEKNSQDLELSICLLWKYRIFSIFVAPILVFDITQIVISKFINSTSISLMEKKIDTIDKIMIKLISFQTQYKDPK